LISMMKSVRGLRPAVEASSSQRTNSNPAAPTMLLCGAIIALPENSR
jgi:hypothetical protein